jgi:hypothetical protein
VVLLLSQATKTIKKEKNYEKGYFHYHLASLRHFGDPSYDRCKRG